MDTIFKDADNEIEKDPEDVKHFAISMNEWESVSHDPIFSFWREKFPKYMIY